MKRVLHILPMNKLSGAEKMALIMCKNMKVYEPVVVCGGEILESIFKKNGIKSYSLNFSSKSIITTVIGLKRIVKENKIRIIHAHDNTASLVGYLTKKIFGLDVKVISHIHNCYPWIKEDGFNKKIDSFIRPKYDYNITCGSVVYDFYKKNTNYFNTDNSTILSNSMDIEEITGVDLSKSEEIIKKYNIPKDKNILGFIGRVSEQKGILPFINEFVGYKENFRDSIILLIGSGEQDVQVKNLIKKLGLEELFILTGNQEDVYKFYPIIDVFFLPSTYEGLPMVILEAMAFKKPVISMNVGSISEVVNKETGVLIEKGDYKTFVSELRKIKDDKNLISTYGNSGYKFINKNYNIKDYVNKVENQYDKLDVGC
ncbi:MAG: glycosyltransferase [Clostridium sp.]|uniref:glycosyltransferase n=1 Tax=Clostridium sp. TaxID=1506 RepID=UPI00304B736A